MALKRTVDNRFYILDGKKPVPVYNVVDWASWFENADRKVALDTIDGRTISTVFLGLDHSFHSSRPLLFETMIFSADRLDEYQERYATWQEAEQGHQRAVDMAKEMMGEVGEPSG